MDSFLIGFGVGFVVGLAIGLRFWWVQRKRRIAAEKVLRVPLGQIARQARR